MPDDSTAHPHADLAHDLRRIREARGLSLDTLHEETKIPLALLRQFEETGLADHPMFNRVYLRSLVRAYAELIGVSTDEALTALDDALVGRYDSSWAAAFLGEGEPAHEAPEAVTPEEEAGTIGAEPDIPTAQPPSAPPGQQEAPPRETVRSESLRSVPLHAGEGEEGEAWDAISPSPGARRREPVAYRQQRAYTQWILVAVGVLVLIGAIWGMVALVSSLGGGETEVAAVDTTTTEPDTTQASAEPERPAITVGDTINVVIVAEGGPVQGIRVTRDDDLRRPYWIEEGQAKAFPALQRIVIEEQLDPIRLVVENYEYPKDQRDDQGRVVITRESAQAFLDTVSTDPVDLSISLERVQRGPIQEQ